jgi:Tfp pilus assembly protein PilF
MFVGVGVAVALLAVVGLGVRARRAQLTQAPVAPPKVAVATPVAPSPPVAVQRDPAKAGELVQRASEWQAANDTGAARDLLEQAVALDPDNAEAHYRLGGLFLNSKPDRARAEYEAAKRLNAPKYADVVDTILKGL